MCYNLFMNMLSEVSILPHIGPKTTDALNRAGIFTVRDFFYYLPRTYENYQAATGIANIRPGKITIKGRVTSVNSRPARSRRLNITEARITDGEDSIMAVWFNQPYRVNQFKKDQDYIFSGEYGFRNGRYQLTSPQVRVAPKDDVTDNQSAFQPIYAAKSIIKPEAFKRWMSLMRPEFAKIPDLLPISTDSPSFVKPGSRQEALFKVHFAENQAEVEKSRQYLAYEELFELILAARLNRQESERLKAPQIEFNSEIMQKFLKNLPFKLTDSQKKVAWEIIQDLGKPTPMNRLLQGDVGSGKTVVAATAALQAISSGFQAVLLAPTSILAAQHAESLDALLRPLGVNVALLTGSTKQKNTLKAQLKQGNIDLLVGTHAVITDDTQFKNLALCIIDEQHRFGVNQRQKLLLKGSIDQDHQLAPHFLAMTATPIPRSLQLTIFGDLDVSIISQMPNGRKPIKTKVFTEIEQKDQLYPAIRTELAAGRQIYWICKTIEDSSKKETISVKKQAEKLKDIFPHQTVEFLHGRMKPAEKDAIMLKFQNHQIDILVSTTVVEVGVDVPNASTIVIMDAESYGLAQLHQLRGRVGRGQHQSYCYLITKEDQPTRRLKEVEKSTDGFHLAEVDLKIRGPGEIYGALQHGALDLRIASLTDVKLVELAQKHAAEFAKHPENMVKYKELAVSIKKYQQLTTLN